MTPLASRERASATAVLSAMALVVLDAGLVNLALPAIGASLQASAASSILLVSAYQAALLAGLLPCARLAERFGCRPIFVGGLALFTAASVVAALAGTLAILVAARILQGLGGAAIMALGIALLRLALGPLRLGAAIAWNAMTVALCSAAAPVLGGLILSVAPWPWLFIAKLPIAAVALAAARGLPESTADAGRPLELLSICLHCATAALILAAVQLIAPHPLPAALLGAGAAASAAFLLRRERAEPRPLWPIDLLGLRPVRLASIASVCCFAGQSAGLIAVPLFLQLALGQGAAEAGLVLACWPVSVAMTSPLANRLALRLSAPLLCAGGASALAAGLLLAGAWPMQDEIWPLAVGAVLSGFGFGLFQLPNNRTLFLSAPAERSAAAGGLQGSARLAGQTIGALTVSLLFAWLPQIAAPRAGMLAGALFAGAAAAISALATVRSTRLLEPACAGHAEARTR